VANKQDQTLTISTKGKRFSISFPAPIADKLFYELLGIVIDRENQLLKEFDDSQKSLQEIIRELSNCNNFESAVATEIVDENQNYETVEEEMYGDQSSEAIEENQKIPDLVTGGTKYRTSRNERLFGKVGDSVQKELNVQINPISERVENISDIQTQPSQTQSPSKLYKGFLVIKCDCCDHVTATNVKEYTDSFECRECHNVIPLSNLKILWAHCLKCGHVARYNTNVSPDSGDFEITCVNCRSFVPITFYEPKQMFVTIGEDPNYSVRRYYDGKENNRQY
jgi:hypothetical protein